MPEQPFGSLFKIPLRNGVNYPARTRGRGVPMINMREIFAFDRIGQVECERVPLTAGEQATYLLEDGDLLFARQSLSYEGAGKCALVAAGSEPRTWEGHIIRVRLDRVVADPRFYFYFFRSPAGRRLIETIIQQVAAAGIRGSDLARLRVPVPTIDEQRAVADVLSAIDDKVAANSKLIEVAEQLMVALAERARTTVPLDNLVKHSTTNIAPASFPDVVHHHSLPAFDDGASATIEHRESIKSNKFLLSEPCVLVSKLNPRIPRIWDVSALLSGISVASTEFVTLVPVGISTSCLWASLRAPAISTVLESLVAGTSGSHQRVKPAELMRIEIKDPRTLSDVARNQITAAGAVVHSVRLERARLKSTRDELLPLLMSGKVRVRDAGENVEGVA